jgi:signal transduction histidine kinase
MGGAGAEVWLSREPTSSDARELPAGGTDVDRATERGQRPAGSGERLPMPDGYEFAAGVAHDLRSPLTSILFLAETLLSGQSGPTNEAQRRQLGIIYSAALGLTSVASDIIELVRGGDGLTEREPMLFSVTEILESVHDIVRPMAEEKGLGVHLFPPAIDHRLGYPLALSRVLLNLTTNGLKFTDSGFVEIAVRATSPTHLEFSVRDTGRGYGDEALQTLYEPFRRTRAGKGFGFSGSGLGLAISRKLISAMGSTLEVETRARWGSRFHFEVELPPGPPLAPDENG